VIATIITAVYNGLTRNRTNILPCFVINFIIISSLNTSTDVAKAHAVAGNRSKKRIRNAYQCVIIVTLCAWIVCS